VAVDVAAAAAVLAVVGAHPVLVMFSLWGPGKGFASCANALC